MRVTAPLSPFVSLDRVRSIKTWLRLTLVTMTIGGGFTGVVVTSQAFSNAEGHGPAHLVLMSGFLALYAFVTASGLFFVWDARCIRPVLAALAIQVPWISTPVIVYKFAAGSHAVLTVGSPEEAGNFGLRFGAEAMLGSIFRFELFQEAHWSIGVNFAALLLLVLSWPRARRPEEIVTGAEKSGQESHLSGS
jgi:hypothetical protein